MAQEKPILVNSALTKWMAAFGAGAEKFSLRVNGHN
jgi:hypothetical protein